jgi:shikimate kinase
LDEEIQKIENTSIEQIFFEKGEPYFRELEKKIWQILGSYDVVSVGGGFDLDLISPEWTILWVRRDTDSFDRIFLDRPSLSDYKRKFNDRENRFEQRADLIYTIPEGLFQTDEDEKQILSGNFKKIGGAVTLPRRLYPDTLIEIRDDLEPRLYETPLLLFSVRNGTTYPPHVKVDWDIKKPIPANLSPYIISTHENKPDALLSYENSGSILKFCPEVNTWTELMEGLEWQKKNPQKHVFLPRSKNGKWSWFRLWMKGKQPLNFWREGIGSAPDQPTLWEWLSHPDIAEKFAAVLGFPIQHSFSPAYHKNFFLKKNIPFYKIQIEEQEWDEAIQILDQLGLIAAAVTSPLKLKAGKFVNKTAINTLWKLKNSWLGENTDKAGAQDLLKDFTKIPCVVWGGGGVLEPLKEILPQATFYSSQAGIPRMGWKEIKDPEVVVWSDPYNSVDKVPKTWGPKVVVDLSYSDKSSARAYAQAVKAKYISGIQMFTTQASQQQRFWSDL